VKATITLTLDPKAAEARFEDDDVPTTAREHFEEYLLGFITDEMNIALWPDFSDDDDPRPAVLTHVKLNVGGKVVYDVDWSFRAEEEGTA
jgi:hypothetical protein